MLSLFQPGLLLCRAFQTLPFCLVTSNVLLALLQAHLLRKGELQRCQALLLSDKEPAAPGSSGLPSPANPSSIAAFIAASGTLRTRADRAGGSDPASPLAAPSQAQPLRIGVNTLSAAAAPRHRSPLNHG